MWVRKKKRTADVLNNSQKIISANFDINWKKYFGNEEKICLEIGFWFKSSPKFSVSKNLSLKPIFIINISCDKI